MGFSGNTNIHDLEPLRRGSLRLIEIERNWKL